MMMLPPVRSAPSGQGDEPGFGLLLSRLPVTVLDEGAQQTAPISALELL